MERVKTSTKQVGKGSEQVIISFSINDDVFVFDHDDDDDDDDDDGDDGDDDEGRGTTIITTMFPVARRGPEIINPVWMDCVADGS